MVANSFTSGEYVITCTSQYPLKSKEIAEHLYYPAPWCASCCLFYKTLDHADYGATFNPLPDEKILGLPKLRAYADDKLTVTQDIKVVFHWIEKIVGKGENAGYQHFLLFPQCFQNAFSSSASKVVFVWQRVKS